MENKSYGLIYRITNLINGKMYIGQTKRDINVRLMEHIYCSKDPKKTRMIIHKAIKKYGVDNFTCQVVKVCYSKEELGSEEIKFIEKYKTISSEFGYNCVLVPKNTPKSNKIERKTRTFETHKTLRNLNCKYSKERNPGKYIGVTEQNNKITTTYISQIRFKNNRIYIGTFFTKEDAAKAYDIKAIELFGEDAVINFDHLLDDYLNNKIKLKKRGKKEGLIVGITYRKDYITEYWIVRYKGYRKSFKTLLEAEEYLCYIKEVLLNI